MDLDSAPGFPASEPLANQGLQEPKSDFSTPGRQPAFSWIEGNGTTWKLTDGRGTNAWDGYSANGAGYRTTRAVAWLMGVGNGMWVVRYRNKSSRPMKLAAAKKYAIEMVKGIRPGVVVEDPVRELNRMAAIVEGYSSGSNGAVAATEKDGPPLASADLLPEASYEADVPIEFDADGHPEIPACLDRRRPKETMS
jgi:hypothetical protein